MTYKSLSAFSLAGGTALALHYGHRISVDLDLFTTKPFNEDSLYNNLKNDFSEIKGFGLDTNAINLFINDIKVDIIAHQYPLLEEVKYFDGIRLFSIQDLIAMKLGAIVKRGSKKDFIDLYEILHHFTLEEVIGFHTEKYKIDDIFYIIRSLTYFQDAEISVDPILLKNQNWEEIKIFISNKVKEYIDDKT